MQANPAGSLAMTNNRRGGSWGFFASWFMVVPPRLRVGARHSAAASLWRPSGRRSERVGGEHTGSGASQGARREGGHYEGEEHAQQHPDRVALGSALRQQARLPQRGARSAAAAQARRRSIPDIPNDAQVARIGAQLPFPTPRLPLRSLTTWGSRRSRCAHWQHAGNSVTDPCRCATF